VDHAYQTSPAAKMAGQRLSLWPSVVAVVTIPAITFALFRPWNPGLFEQMLLSIPFLLVIIWACALVMKRPAVGHIAQALVLVPVAGVIGTQVVVPIVSQTVNRVRVEWSLPRATTRSELEAVAGSLGIVLDYPDGWIAIHYADSHAGFGWEWALARDSSGRYYESREHYCGAFSGYRGALQALSRAQADFEGASDAFATSTLESLTKNLRDQPIHPLASASDLESAVAEMQALGFNRRQ
jgi:hypothetical protein